VFGDEVRVEATRGRIGRTIADRDFRAVNLRE
jgi:hypothetical protein